MEHVESKINECPIETNMDLVSRIITVAKGLREMPVVFANAHQSPPRRCEACITTGKHSFEQFL